MTLTRPVSVQPRNVLPLSGAKVQQPPPGPRFARGATSPRPNSAATTPRPGSRSARRNQPSPPTSPGANLTVTRPKSGKAESIPLNATARQTLASVERTGPLVFPALAKKLTDLFKRYVEKAKLPKEITFHCLRDTYISRLAEHVSTPTLMQFARHSDYRTTKRGAKIDGDHLRAAAESLENWPVGGKKVAEVDALLAETWRTAHTRRSRTSSAAATQPTTVARTKM
jgi:hypothetical protein